MQAIQTNIANDASFVPQLGQGAVFWVHISTDNKTRSLMKYWKVTLEHEDKLWKGEITSIEPAKVLKAPELSGIFHVTVEVMGADNELKTIQAFNTFQSDIGCNSNCASMIGIEADEYQDIRYWTVWNSFCHYDDHSLYY